MIIAGDFNYALPSSSVPRTTRPPQRWLHFLQCHFRNVISELRGLDTPTFRRGDTTHSAIDFIYISLDLSVHYVDAEVDFLNPQ
jgi:endonuclease/exonuclease/phosphatase family metal-dependent hydrolase